ncbi:hypothetical protein MBM_01243 [Drepanopeziza brunnea f. sp. 'multigermtubi' MB_m1]|uniref:Uncharacterized protein n=1 Tax=Marssonina brunnea f. sp. multigermtubi (strain MB_m1) TaxID=1072389 RepID=K1X5Z5_MARBU|nr:uncharacterized protein MBM_01243 [Drepanopeziza brunnea f. sp. 'multigermtubi' MB_m1]EKD20561.1 hypothetical protein MBM_01243 [Drepanopeziza brunnea f. sp. 'multigermtubi' MB_m1]
MLLYLPPFGPAIGKNTSFGTGVLAKDEYPLPAEPSSLSGYDYLHTTNIVIYHMGTKSPVPSPQSPVTSPLSNPSLVPLTDATRLHYTIIVVDAILYGTGRGGNAEHSNQSTLDSSPSCSPYLGLANLLCASCPVVVVVVVVFIVVFDGRTGSVDLQLHRVPVLVLVLVLALALALVRDPGIWKRKYYYTLLLLLLLPWTTRKMLPIEETEYCSNCCWPPGWRAPTTPPHPRKCIFSLGLTGRDHIVRAVDSQQSTNSQQQQSTVNSHSTVNVNGPRVDLGPIVVVHVTSARSDQPQARAGGCGCWRPSPSERRRWKTEGVRATSSSTDRILSVGPIAPDSSQVADADREGE